jgi:hypothetical protein
MDWKEQLRNKALSLLSEPRVTAMLSDPRVSQGIINVLRLRGQVEEQVGQSVRQIAKTLNLATAAEVQELRRAISRLERQLEQERHEQAEIAADSRVLS